MRSTRLCALGGVVVCVLTTTPALAFKIPTHVASANRALDELSTVIKPGSTPDTIVFEVKGRRLELKVSAKEAYRAILDHPEFFKAGIIGPDGFPDLITGQYWQHSNQNPQAQDLTRQATEGRISPIDHPTTDQWERRHGPSEFRSVDFAMRLFEHLLRGNYPFQGQERAQALAFILGYFSHGIGDSFAHTWVNELAGGSWELGTGKGVFGPITEEVKHVAVEGLADHRVPGSLQNLDGSTGGEVDRHALRAPVQFLDHFFSSTVPNPLMGYGDKGSAAPGEYLNFWKNIDQFHGSAVYNYLNLQADAARGVQQFSGMKRYMDWAEKYQPGAFVNILLDIANWPEQVKGEFERWFAGDVVSFVTGGFLKCELFNSGDTGLEMVRKVWDYLGGFNGRIRRYEERGRVVRINWMRLSECTAQNLARANGGDFNPAEPGRHRDACTVLADRPWADEGDGTGLFRASLREGVSEDDDEFLRDLKSYFRGADDDGDGLFRPEELIEPTNRHRHIGGNLSRLKSYLLGFAFILDDLEDVIITDQHESSLDRVCGLARDPAEKRCLNLRLLGLALPYEQAKCLKEFAECEAGVLLECAKGLCKTACSGTPVSIIPGACNGLCNAGEAVCDQAIQTQCELLPGACVGIPGVACIHTPIYGVCADALDPVCDYLAGGNPQCLSDVLQCGVKEVKCGVEALELLFLEKGWADRLLNPVKDVCNTVDEARDFFRRYDTLTKRLDEAERHGVPVRKINELIDVYRSVADKFRGYPPEYFVNVAFAYEDLRQDPTYFRDYLAAIEREAAKVQMLPEGREKEIKLGAIAKLRRLGTAVGVGQPSELLTFDFSQDPDNLTDAAKRELEEFGALLEMLVIPAVPGPTAKRVLADIGPDFQRTFNPFFNTVQGLKLVGVNSRADVEALFTANAVPLDRLPWSVGASHFSQHCLAGDPINLFCDVFMSFDDPNCFGAEGTGCRPEDRVPNPARFDWVSGRGLVVWNKYDPTGATRRNILTNLPIAASDQAYQALYTRIFDVPQQNPAFTGFEDPERRWLLPPDSRATLTENTQQKTEGGASLQVNGCGWLPLRSPTFDTAEFAVVGDELSVDVFIPQRQSSPHWIGEVHLNASVPAAGIYEQHLGWQSLTSLPRGQWSTLRFPVPANLRAALLGDYPNARFALALNFGSCLEPVLVDNFRFTGHLTNRTVFHRQGSDGLPVSSNLLLSFENAADWRSPQTAVTSDTTTFSHLQASLAVPIRGWTEVRSRNFSNADLAGVTVTTRLNLDLFVPEPQPNQHWVGDVMAAISCPGRGIFQQHLGSKSLTNVFQGEFNSLQFDLPAGVVSVLRGTFTDCSFSFSVTGNSGAGTFLFDKVGFVGQ